MAEMDRILGATASLLRAKDERRLTFEAVAAQASVPQASLYRRWNSPAELIGELIREMAESEPIPPHSDDLRQDLTAGIVRLTRALERARPLLLSVARQSSHPPLEGELRLLFASWQEPVRRLAIRARNQGAMRPHGDLELATDFVVGLLWLRAVQLGERDLSARAAKLADATLSAWSRL